MYKLTTETIQIIKNLSMGYKLGCKKNNLNINSLRRIFQYLK